MEYSLIWDSKIDKNLETGQGLIDQIKKNGRLLSDKEAEALIQLKGKEEAKIYLNNELVLIESKNRNRVFLKE